MEPLLPGKKAGPTSQLCPVGGMGGLLHNVLGHSMGASVPSVVGLCLRSLVRVVFFVFPLATGCDVTQACQAAVDLNQRRGQFSSS